ncbi:MAG: hypothetical protein EOO05_00715 [Chitinophagaceae bacterium]|nr:MAG: hypothetical protein EOO05_00715 [Chitinophagaceae bacterium]
MNTNLPAGFRVQMHRIITLFLSFLLLLISSFNAGAQTTLAQGDLSITAFSANAGSKGITFVPWVNLSAGTVIKFTDNGFNSILNANIPGNIRWREQVITWTATSAVAAGTTVSITGNAPGTTSTGTVVFRAADGITSQNWDLNTLTGDQVFAFQGSGGSAVSDAATFNGTILCGIGFQGQSITNGSWMLLGNINDALSYLPGELTLGDNLYFPLLSTGAQYTGPRTGFSSILAYKLAVANILNWTAVIGGSATISHNLLPFVPVATPPVVTVDPIGSNVCAGAASSFTVAATGATTYQWQVDGGIGWLNIIDLPPYSGAGTATLSLSFTTSLMNGNKYRCVVGGSNYINSGVATLRTSHVISTTTQNNVSCNGGSNGSATVIPANGIAPYTYQWTSLGSSNASVSGLQAGIYSVKVTDAIGCIDNEVVAIVEPTALVATSDFTNVSCNGGANGSAGVIVGGGVFPYSFAWTPSGGTANVALGLTAGNYAVTATDMNGCTITKNFNITQPAALTASTSVTNIACSGGLSGSATVTPTGGTAPYGYLWLPVGGLGATANNLPAGNYTCTIVDSKGCSIVKSVSISQPAAISLGGSQVNVSCFGGSNGSATVTASGGTGSKTYSWFPSGGSGATASGLASGIYTVTVTDANGCTATKTFVIAQPLPMVVTALHTDVSCTGFFDGTASATVLGGTAPYTYNWSPSGGTGAVATGLEVGTYTCTVTDANGCTVTASYTIGQLTTITATSTQTNVSCYGGNNGSATVTPSGGIAPYTYSWSPAGGTGATATGLSAGTYTVNIRGALGCAINKTIVITEPAPIAGTANTTTQNFCSGNATSITLSSADPAVTFSWTVTNISGAVTGASAGSGNSITQTLNGKGIIEYMVTPAKGSCTGDPIVINVVVKGLTTLTSQPVDVEAEENETVLFNVNATNWTLFQWQVDRGAGFESLADDEQYENVNTWQMTIHNVTSALSGNRYRCIAYGNCTAGVISNSALLTINNGLAQTISFPDFDSVVYGTPDFNPGATSTSGLAVVYSSSDDNIASIVNGKIHIKKVGTVLITAKQPGNATYKAATPVQRQLTVTPKALTLQLNAIPGVTKTYDGNNLASLGAGNYTLVGLVGQDAVSVSGTAVYDNAKAGENKTVTISDLALAGDDKDNYSFSVSSATTTGTITRKALTAVLDDLSVITKVYDGNTIASIPAGVYQLTGMIGTDKVNLNNPTTGIYDTKHGGENKLVTVTGLEISGDDAANYSLDIDAIQPAKGAITRKQVTLMAATATKVYGQPDPEFSYSVETLVAGDVLPGALGRTAGKDVGTYDINLGSIDGGSDYEIITFVQSTLSITKKDLEIRADAKWKNCGKINPEFTFTYIGLVGNDPATELERMPQASTTADHMSPIGEYPITVWGAASKNYEITHNHGTLTVMPADNSEFDVRIWSYTPGTIQVRIYTRVAQNASIVLYNRIGQEVIVHRKALAAGINSFTIPVDQLAAGPYVVGVGAARFRVGQKLMIR